MRAKIWKLIVVFAIAFVSMSCQVMRHEPMSAVELERRSGELELALLGLSGVDAANADVSAEAQQIARVCVVEGERFAIENRAVRPSWWNNCLVNVGIHRSGLCWQYQDYLYAKLDALTLSHFKAHCSVSNQGRLFYEHHCVVIVPLGGEFHDGLVIDPWKKSGKTVWFATQGESGDWSDQPKRAESLDKRLESSM